MTGTQAQVVETITEEQVDIPSEIAQAETRADLQKKMEEISSNKLKNLLQQEAKLHKEIEKLSSLDGESRDSRTIAIKQTDLKTIRAEIAKRGEDLASLSYAIAGEMEVFGRLSGEALQDSSEDVAKKQVAYDAVDSAEKRLVDVKAQKKSAESRFDELETGLEQIKSSFFWGRKGRVAEAEQSLRDIKRRILDARSAIESAEQNVVDAKEQVPVVLEQVQVDKRNRIKNASLEETYTSISKWVAQAKKVLKADIGEYKVRIAETKKAHSTAIERRLKASKRMRAAEELVVTLDEEFSTSESDREDIVDRTDPTYQTLTASMDAIAIKLDAAKNEQKLAEGGFSDAEIATKERSTSLMALTAQNELAKHHYNKFVVNEETAHFIGQNIEVLVKGATREVLNESLDRGVQKMTVAVYEVAQRTRITSTKQLGELQQRKIDILAVMTDMDDETEEAIAQEHKEYEEVIQKLREGYAKEGLDVEDMSSLNAAAELSAQVTGTVQDSKISEADLF